MTVPETLRKVLVCPAPDHGSLIEESNEGVPMLSCTVCGSRFAIEGAIPVMLMNQAVASGITDDSAGSPAEPVNDAGQAAGQSHDLR